ncbi:hypothetical protein [Methylocella sp.]|jgi:DNA-binding transcriptional regulator YdaS (Cro superfamily)|uniref:hypothetical protein n=1 Tax=Methylocella sp. TaxID=1978226 RepID=UPI003C14E6D4
MGNIVTKSAFAELIGVSPSRVSQWLASGQLGGAAIVGEGHRARIRVDVAKEHLRKNLDVDQSLGANGKAKTGPKPRVAAAPADATDDQLPVEEKIKAERLLQLSLANAKSREEAAARAGRYTATIDAKQALGRTAARLMTIFEASLSEFANALAAKPSGNSREMLRTLRATWAAIRQKQAVAAGAEADALPTLIEDEDRQ